MKRAITNEQKREIIERLYAVWIKEDYNHLRLGQLMEIVNIWKPNVISDSNLFYFEDYDLIEELENED